MRDSRTRYALAILGLVAALAAAGCIGMANDKAPKTEQQTGTKDPGEAIDRRIVVDVEATPCPPGYNNYHNDEVCLAYDGEIPGPTWVFEQGERVEIKLRHRVQDTIQQLEADDETVQRLTHARYSMHRHGLSLDACSDGIAKIEGTDLCDSTLAPGESITYTFNASFPGAWHYHDHGKAFNGDPVHAGLLGTEAEDRGLWGSFLVLEPGETTDHVFDLHVLDQGINGDLGLDETLPAGERFDIIAVGLGHRSALDTVTLTDPGGTTVDEVLIGPGVSRGLTVDNAQPGTYTWTVETAGFDTDYETETHEGTIHVEGTSTKNEASHRPRTGPTTPTTNEPIIEAPDRTFAIDFSFTTADARATANQERGGPPSGLPLLEAYAGETLRFHVVNSQARFQHTFHLHGHPWEHPDTGEMIDIEPMNPGDTHTFTVTAGLGEGHTGDWLYHCHIGADVGPMWGILRVYEHTMETNGPLDALEITLEDEEGTPIEDATLEPRWNPNVPTNPAPGADHQAQTVTARVTETQPGTYHVEPHVPFGEPGELVIESSHPTGDSLTRLSVAPDGSYEEKRDVNLLDENPSATLHPIDADGGGHLGGWAQ